MTPPLALYAVIGLLLGTIGLGSAYVVAEYVHAFGLLVRALGGGG